MPNCCNSILRVVTNISPNCIHHVAISGPLTQRDAKSLEDILSHNIDQLLEPAQVRGLDNLPPQVASVFQFVFDEDSTRTVGGHTLSNPMAIDAVLDHMEGEDKVPPSERSRLKAHIEKAIRKMVSKFLAESKDIHTDK